MKIDDIHEMAHDINNYVREHHMLKSLNQYLFDENERLNTNIDELEERIDKALHKLKSSVNHFRTQRENNAVTFTIRILEGKENE